MITTLLAWLREAAAHGIAGYAVLAVMFAAGALVPFPRTPLVIASGFLLGMSALPVVAIATTLGGCLAFALSRSLLRQRIHDWVTGHRYAAALLRAVELEGWKVIALMRFYGPLPSTVMNYGFGLADISFRVFALATFVCTLPQLALYCYLGSLGGTVLDGRMPTGLSYLTLGVALSCALSVLILLGRRMRALLEIHATA
ncbi:MAG: VTT domain-containing protein [Acidisphaera sp.]|nr:VTT domain-containing protein [Acidisphaera sp.]MBV9812947.1 VTT domain-containing protein [Acetobacteraceae bacterium]